MSRVSEKMDQAEREKWWRARAVEVRRRVNAGWWLSRFIPSSFALCVAFACVVLVGRRLDWSWMLPAIGFGASLAGAAVLSWWLVRRRFFDASDGLVRLEMRYRLHNRLTAASAGVGAWPGPVPGAGSGLTWVWRRNLALPALALLLLAAAVAVPVVRPEAEAARLLDEPAAWGEVEAWLDTLEVEEVVEDRALERLTEQVAELRVQPMESWYTHSSLEAGDNLKEQSYQAIRELERHLNTSVAGLRAIEEFEGGLPAELAELWGSEMAGALEGFDLGKFPLDPELLEQLQSIGLDPATLRPLSAEEMAALRDALERGLQACRDCTGGDTNLVALAALCQGWSQGGVNRGPGPAPLMLKERETRLDAGQLEALAHSDYTQASVGDTLAVREVDHDVDPTSYAGPSSAGAVEALGQGGETVWRNPVVPEEQDILTRFYK